MSQRPDGLPEDAPLPRHLDPRGGSRRRPSPQSADRGELPPDLDPRGRSSRRSAEAASDVRPARGWRGRGLRAVLVGTLAVLLLLGVAGLGTLVYYDRRIDRVPVATLGQGADPDGRDQNYLLVGSDSREGLTEEELAEVRTGLKGGGNEGTLTDTVVLLHVPAGGGTPTAVSFPRDSWVEIPGHGRGRINTAYSLGEREGPGGGPAKLVATVQQLSGLQVDHYVEIGFIAFLRITDALGGIKVNLCGPVADEKAAIDLPAGEQRLDGGDALGFVRQRDGLPRGDLDRVARQQYFLGQAARQVASPGTLLRPDRGIRLLSAVTSSVTADEDLSTFDLARLAWRLRGAGSGGLAFTTVPVSNPAARKGQALVVELDEPALPAFFTSLSPDEPSGTPPETVAVAPSAIRLEVRNGTSRAGLARTAGEDLAGQGFTVTRTANADRQDFGESVVLHGSNRADSARTVAASVPGAVLRQDDSLGANGLVLVVGESYAGARAVTVDGGGEQEPEPEADPGGEAPAPEPEPAAPCIV
jgi:LCP family protein required for cell wall assembly